MGIRTRAARARAAAQLGENWLWPRWLERQLDPHSAAFVPRGRLPVPANLTRRDWTAVGNVGSPRRAIVDPCGLVTPWFDGWSLDWWIGADDRWHLPSRESGIRQRLVAGTPVIETAMRIPGGDAIQRVYAIRTQEDLAVVEIANQSPVPVAVAFAVRPVNPDGLAVVERIAIHDRTVTVNGRPAVLFAKRPAMMAGGTMADGDSAWTVTSGRAGPSLPASLRCEAGLAQAAFVFPLAHRTTLSVALPLTPERRRRRRGMARRGAAGLPELPAVLPSGEDVARSWHAQTRRGMRLVLPAGRMADAVEASRRALLLFHTGDDVRSGTYTESGFRFRDAAYLLGALDRYGFHDEAAEVLRSYPRRQRHDGSFRSQREECDANGSALWAMAEHWRLTRDEDLLLSLGPSVAKAVRWIERKCRAPRRKDSFWALSGLREGATLLSAAGDTEAAATAAGWAAGMAADLDASMAGRPLDWSVIGSLVACYPLGLLGPDSAAMAATVELIRSQTGPGTSLTAQLALVELEAGDRRALDRLDGLVEVASPTFAWPEAIHPQLGSGCAGDGQHGGATAGFLTLVRDLLVREVRPAPTTLVEAGGAASAPAALDLCSMLPTAWWGQGIEVHDAPTAHGRMSFAVRWHGERAALLWELVPRPGVGPVRLRIPGLDPSWSTDAPSGDVLLSPLSTGSFS